MPPYPSALPEYYNTEVMVYRGFWMDIQTNLSRIQGGDVVDGRDKWRLANAAGGNPQQQVHHDAVPDNGCLDDLFRRAALGGWTMLVVVRWCRGPFATCTRTCAVDQGIDTGQDEIAQFSLTLILACINHT